MNNIYIGIDDTDNHESRGTGYLARVIAGRLADRYSIHGVTRHQLLFDPRVPYTAKNSCAAIILKAGKEADLKLIFSEVKGFMLADFQKGSDPGLCVCSEVSEEIHTFGKLTQKDLVVQAEALELAEKYHLLLEGLGGTRDGVIGALAAVGLAASGNDGRYIQVGRARELNQLVSLDQLYEAGIDQVRDLEGAVITSGNVLAEKLRPSRRESKVILFSHWCGDHWAADKLD